MTLIRGLRQCLTTQGLKNMNKLKPGLDSATIPVARDDVSRRFCRKLLETKNACIFLQLDSITCLEKISLKMEVNQIGMNFYTPKAKILKECLSENSYTKPLQNVPTGMIGVIISKDPESAGTYDELSKINTILTKIIPLPKGSMTLLQKKIIPLAALFGESSWSISDIVELYKNIAPIESLHIDLVNTINGPAAHLTKLLSSSQMNLVRSLELRKE